MPNESVSREPLTQPTRSMFTTSQMDFNAASNELADLAHEVETEAERFGVSDALSSVVAELRAMSARVDELSKSYGKVRARVQRGS